MAVVIGVVLGVLVVLLLVFLVGGVKVVQQYEQGVVFRLGRVLAGTRQPGLTLVVPVVDRLVKVNMQIVTMGVPAQEGITRDNVTLRVDAVVYFRVVDPVKAIVNVQNYLFAVSQVSQTSLRSVIGRSDLDDMLSDRDRLNLELASIIDEPTEGPWGIKIERVELKDVSLPEGMKRSMSRQAEAERERRARIITADGELQASVKLAQAGRALSVDPSGLQLRLLQTVVEVAAEKNSTLVMPFPVELLRFLDRAGGGDGSGNRAPAPAAAVPPAPTPAGNDSDVALHKVGNGVPDASVGVDVLPPPPPLDPVDVPPPPEIPPIPVELQPGRAGR